MEYNFLGKSGLRVSNICLGTMTFGKAETGPIVFTAPSQLQVEDAHKILDRYIELGGNFVDTANIYSYGQSEDIIGKWFAKTGKRDEVVLATKARAPMGKGVNDGGLNRRHLIKACEESLKRLQTDYIDLYQTHAWDAATPLEETLRTLDDLVKCGKIRYVGVSNVCGWQMQKLVDLTKSMGLSPVISLQQQYNLLCRHPEYEEFQVCKNEGVGVIPWSPLKGGLLTGKYKRGQKPEAGQGRVGAVAANEKLALQSAPAWSKFDNDFYWNLRDGLEQIGNDHGKTESQVALKWLLQKDIVPSVIIGCTSISQLEQNCAAATGWSLKKEQVFTAPTQLHVEESHKILDRYIELGGNFVDTANMYCYGQSEEIIGKWFAKTGKRDDVVLATKAYVPMGQGINDGGLSRRHLVKACEDSLKRLQTDYIDLYQELTLNKANVTNTETPFLDLNIKIINGEIHTRVYDKRDDFGFNIVNFPWLDGDVPRLPSYGIYISQLIRNNTTCCVAIPSLKNLEFVKTKVSESFHGVHLKGKTESQVALRWLLQKDIVPSVIIGCTSISQLEQNCAIATGWSLTKQEQQYSLLCRHSEYEEFQVCKNEGVGVLPWSPLKGGLLTGKYKRGQKPQAEQGRIGLIATNEKLANQAAPAWTKYDNDFYWNLRGGLEQIGKDHGKTESQVALKWLLQKDIVPSVIIGCTSISQLEQNCAAATGWSLTKEQMDKLDELSSTEKPYPYEMIDRGNMGRKNTFHPSPAVFTAPTQLQVEESHKIIDRFIKLGGNFIDTANMYCDGQSEEIIGKWFVKTGKRDDVVVATKARAPMGRGVNDCGLSRRHLLKACEDSLKRLQTNYIDLYQTHFWDASTPLEETLRTLDDLVKCGKIRYFGVSNVCGWQMQKIVDLTKSMGLSSVISLQQQYSLLCRHPEYEEFQVCKNEGVGVLPWSPLKGGLLTGKYKRGKKPQTDQGRIGLVAANEKLAIESAPAWSKCDNEFYWNLRGGLEEIGKDHGKTESQVALRWLLQKDIVPSVIIGCTSIGQLEQNCAAATGWKLTKEQMDTLDELSSTEKPYPYEMIGRGNMGRKNTFHPSPAIGSKY
ncbi:hypothetical protein FSP39_015472 [Pinctada imbricata]|uniref:NADP-dependent oxidoreductase domain-containing protein n=1 Tax=Pinctada imbricata TaxID=66713 RepID=A0AA89BUX8_PINIB|nr:hypothetical protein FSP39_015472 [Pinctada imbricata]